MLAKHCLEEFKLDCQLRRLTARTIKGYYNNTLNFLVYAEKHHNHQWDDFICTRENGDLIPLEYVSRAFPKLCKDCGLRELKLHELRHTNISLLLSDGASMKEVQEWAGHSNYSVTANTYAHIQAKSKSRLTDSISSLLG